MRRRRGEQPAGDFFREAAGKRTGKQRVSDASRAQALAAIQAQRSRRSGAGVPAAEVDVSATDTEPAAGGGGSRPGAGEAADSHAAPAEPVTIPLDYSQSAGEAGADRGLGQRQSSSEATVAASQDAGGRGSGSNGEGDSEGACRSQPRQRRVLRILDSDSDDGEDAAPAAMPEPSAQETAAVHSATAQAAPAADEPGSGAHGGSVLQPALDEENSKSDAVAPQQQRDQQPAAKRRRVLSDRTMGREPGSVVCSDSASDDALPLGTLARMPEAAALPPGSANTLQRPGQQTVQPAEEQPSGPAAAAAAAAATAAELSLAPDDAGLTPASDSGRTASRTASASQLAGHTAALRVWAAADSSASRGPPDSLPQGLEGEWHRSSRRSAGASQQLAEPAAAASAAGAAPLAAATKSRQSQPASPVTTVEPEVGGSQDNGLLWDPEALRLHLQGGAQHDAPAARRCRG